MSPLDSQGRPASPSNGLERPPGQPPMRVVLEQGGALGRWGNRLAWIGLAICVLVIVSLIGKYQSYFQTNPAINEKYHSLSRTATDKLAIITIDGTIMHDEGFVKWQIDQVREDEAVKAVVLRIDSPGGTVTGSDYIYHHLKKLVADKNIPLVVSMGGIAASGGYYVAMAVGETRDSIFAEPTTWTGSIGVIIPHYDLSGLLQEKLNVRDDSVASHPLKQMGSPTKPMTEDERKILQALVDESFENFKQIVRSGRPELSEEKLKEVATGQIFTAGQAKEKGLVDELGFIEDAIARALVLAKLDQENVRVVKYTRPSTLLDDVLMGPLGQQREPDLAFLLGLTAPRAYYLSTWLPAIAGTGRGGR